MEAEEKRRQEELAALQKKADEEAKAAAEKAVREEAKNFVSGSESQPFTSTLK